MDPVLAEKYFFGLSAYLKNPCEENLYQAFLLSSSLVEQGIGPDEMVELHSEALKKSIQGKSALSLMNSTMQSLTFLLEVMIAYGLIHKRFLDSRDAQITQLKTYVEEIENLNTTLDRHVKELEVITLIADILAMENEGIHHSLSKVSANLESLFPECLLIYIQQIEDQTEIWASSKGEPLNLTAETEVLVHKLTDKIELEISTSEIEGFVWTLLPISPENTEAILVIRYSNTCLAPDPNFWLTIKNLVFNCWKKLHLIRQLRTLSIQDSMTGIYNYRFFVEALDHTVKRSQRSGIPFALMLLDIDNFKTINDGFGHLFGDQVLKEVALAIKTCTRNSDILCRYGGDEFIIVFPDTSLEQARQIGDRISQVIENSRFGQIQLTISAGISEYEGETNPLELISRTDAALYKAKHLGKNLVLSSSSTHTFPEPDS